MQFLNGIPVKVKQIGGAWVIECGNTRFATTTTVDHEPSQAELEKAAQSHEEWFA